MTEGVNQKDITMNSGWTPGPWHLAALNDGLFIIDKAPPAVPGMVLNVTELPHYKAHAIVDAHNAALLKANPNREEG